MVVRTASMIYIRPQTVRIVASPSGLYFCFDGQFIIPKLRLLEYIAGGLFKPRYWSTLYNSLQLRCTVPRRTVRGRFKVVDLGPFPSLGLGTARVRRAGTGACLPGCRC